MGSQRVVFLAAGLLILKGCLVYGNCIPGCSGIPISGGQESSGCSFIIPAVIKPVLQPECAPAVPNVPDYGLSGGFGGVGGYGCTGGYGNYAPMPPIIVEESGDDNLWPLYLLIFALRGFGNNNGGCGGGCGGGCAGYGGYGGYGGCGGCGGYFGYGGRCGCGCGGYGGCTGCGYNNGGGCGGGFCGCGGCNYPFPCCNCRCDCCGCCCCDDTDSGQNGCNSGTYPNAINLIISADCATTTSTND